MHQYSFMRRKAVEKRDISVYDKNEYEIEMKKRDISVCVKNKYKIEIESLMDWNIFYEKIVQILESAINRNYIDELYEIGKRQREETKEIAFLKDVISDIVIQISEIDFLIPDLKVDCYMGVLYNEKRIPKPEEEMEQGWGPVDEESRNKYRKSDDLERIQNAQKHYPYAKYEGKDFPINGIPGGCIEYHRQMMSQKNINIFASDINKENKNISFRRYGFFRIHNIYEELSSSPIENLLLLEKTLGIGYTNQLFYYVKDFTDRNQLNKLEEIIRHCASIPMFARKYITDKFWKYLKSFGYSDLSIQFVEEASCLIASLVDEAYEAVLEIYWYAHYWEYLNRNKDEEGKSAEDKELRNCWERYFDEEAAYENIVKKENIHDWRGIEKVEDCFYCWNDKYRMDELNLFDDKIVYVDIMVDDDIRYQLAVPGARNELGEDILKMTAERLNEEIFFHEKILKKMSSNSDLDSQIRELSVCKWNGRAAIYTSNTIKAKSLSHANVRSNDVQKKENADKLKELYDQIEENNRELYDLYYRIRYEKFEELKENEQKILDKDMKANVKKLKPLHVYALIQADIIYYLND